MESPGPSMQRIFAGVILASGFLTACGSSTAPPLSQPGSSSPPSSPSGQTAAVTVTISPNAIGVRRGQSVDVTASVQGASDATVKWSIQEGSTGGAISGTGVYTAPAVAGVYHIVATAQADPTKSAVATVNVWLIGFTFVNSLNFARLQHTATLLPSGKVLIAVGGEGPDLIDGFWVVDEAESFDPAIGLFSPAGEVPHDAHTATLLPDGDVLIAGGETDSGLVTATAELAKAQSGLLEPTGSMVNGREGHQATLLNSGKVLITGGWVTDEFSSGAKPYSELYDPATGTFATCATMNAPRAFHTSTLLPNGMVLLTGGVGDGGFRSSTAELFDPTSSSFKPVGNMNVAREDHSATLLPNGKVLIVGGSTVLGTPEELFDPGTGTFTPTGSMAVARMWHTATPLPDGTVLIAGGYIGVGSLGFHGSTATTEIYDPATGLFTPGPTMEQGRFSHTATLLPGGSVLFAGGASSGDGLLLNVLASAEIYH